MKLTQINSTAALYTIKMSLFSLGQFSVDSVMVNTLTLGTPD